MSGNKEFKKEKLFELHALNGGNAAIFSSIDMEDNNSHSDTDISDEDEKVNKFTENIWRPRTKGCFYA